MNASTEHAAPDDALAHAAGLTEADVDALEAFLTHRFDAMLLVHPGTSDESRAARALADALHRRAERVRACFRYDDGSQKMLGARMQHWNRLCRLAHAWRSADGYDRVRWTPVQHRDAAHVALEEERDREVEEKLAAATRRSLVLPGAW